MASELLQITHELDITPEDVFLHTVEPLLTGGERHKIVTKDGRKLYWPTEAAPVRATNAVPAKVKKK